MKINKFPKEVGLPRKTIYNKEDYFKFINLYNGMKKAVYSSVYSFDTIYENGKPDYNSAIVTQIFFDFDDKSCNSYEECKKLHLELLRENIQHHIIMSGRGYHLKILTFPTRPSNIKSCIYNSQHYFIGRLNLTVDTQVIGNPAQLARIPNTYNSKAKLFCIPLTKEQFDKGDLFIKQLAKKQNFVKEIIGEQLFEVGKFDYKSNRIEKLEFTQEFEDSCNENYFENCDSKIKQLLMKKELHWKERYIVILYFKEKGFTEKETCKILKDNLSERKFKHCVLEERQLQYLYERDDLMFPEKQVGIKVYK